MGLATWSPFASSTKSNIPHLFLAIMPSLPASTQLLFCLDCVLLVHWILSSSWHTSIALVTSRQVILTSFLILIFSWCHLQLLVNIFISCSIFPCFITHPCKYLLDVDFLHTTCLVSPCSDPWISNTSPTHKSSVTLCERKGTMLFLVQLSNSSCFHFSYLSMPLYPLVTYIMEFPFFFFFRVQMHRMWRRPWMWQKILHQWNWDDGSWFTTNILVDSDDQDTLKHKRKIVD